MREEDREIVEEAIRKSGGGEDFDEMLLRATKKHLPRNYHRQFGLMLEEILKEADGLGVSNRIAAQSLMKKLGSAPKVTDAAEDVLVRILERPPAPTKAETAGPRGAAPAPTPIMEPLPEPTAGPSVAGTGDGEGTKEAPPEGSVEKLPEEQKILDLGGTHPESLSPEIKDKLRKLVKAQKAKKAWEEGAPEEEPAPGLFFKGQQRAPPFVPLSKPAKKEEDRMAPAGKSPVAEDEEDLEGPVEKDTKAGK